MQAIIAKTQLAIDINDTIEYPILVFGAVSMISAEIYPWSVKKIFWLTIVPA